MSDEYVKRCEKAQRALRKVIRMTEPGTGWKLHAAYAELSTITKRGAGIEDAPASDPPSPSGGASGMIDWEKRREVARRWGQLPAEERERLVIEQLGERRLTLAELAGEMRAAHPDTCGQLYDTTLRPHAQKMIDRGVLAREGEQFRGKTRYRYFQPVKLEGPIADLDRAFRDEAARKDAD